MAAPSTSTGIVVYRASRLEALLDPLILLLDANPADFVLAPQTVIAAHPGIQQWLLGALARKRGHRSIVANLDVPLPSAWLDRLARHLLGRRTIATSAYQRDHLRWRIHDLLEELDDPQIRDYLSGTEVARRRFQLADRLARIYTQYLVYRPDWLQAWGAGRTTTPAPGFHQPLWQKLRARIGLGHRGERMSALIEALESSARLRNGGEPVHLFGISHLAPSELSVFRAVARHRLVVMYVPDPCREFWAGMPLSRQQSREWVHRDAQALPDPSENESLFLQQPHPLLAAWGRMGQHFLIALEDCDPVIDQRHWEDEIAPGRIDGRLQGVQESIRQFQPSLLAPHGDPLSQRADRSLRVHACHTRLRELEVLRDALLRELSERSDLKPSDIVVMAPNIQAYAPLLPAVFGEAGVHAGPLPYHLADVAIASSHPLFGAFARLLDLPQSRLTAPEVVDLLAVPQISSRFGLSSQDVETIAGWLANGRVAWALDAAFRARFDVPAIAEHSFAWGMDRMLTAYAAGAIDGEEQLVVSLPDGSEIAPLDGVAGPQAVLLGALDGALIELARWCELGAQSRRASSWAALLESRFEAVFRIDARSDALHDLDARDTGTVLLRLIRAIANEPAQSDLDPELEFAVVRDLLLERIRAISEDQSFLIGGATVCGMVAQRAVPFRVVAVLGLNDGEFPRIASDGGLDLMTHHHRMGDRDVRSDDRYLFLQTLMSARDALHLSYIGEGVRDGKPRNPAAPLAELLAALDAAAAQEPGNDNDGLAGDRPFGKPWLIRHPLQPFDDRYFDGRDPALFSYRRDFAEMDTRIGQSETQDERAPAPFPIAIDEVDANGAETVASLADVLAYFKDPARQFLTRRMKLRLDALDDDRLADSESLDPKVEAIDGVARRLFMECIARADRTVPAQPPAWLRLTGLLPPGRPGEEAWQNESAKVQGLLDNMREHRLFSDGAPRRTLLPAEHRVGNYRIEGELRRACETADARWILDVFPGKQERDLDFRQRIGLFLEWGLLRWSDPEGSRSARMCALCPGKKLEWQASINAWDARYVAAARDGDRAELARMRSDLHRRLTGLLDHWRSAQSDPRWYFPKTSWFAANRPEIAARTWLGSTGSFGGIGERDYQPGYAHVLAGNAAFAVDDADFAILHDVAEGLLALISLTVDAVATA